MPSAIKAYVRIVEAVNRTVGLVVMWGIFLLMGILLYSSLSRTLFDVPINWAVEMAQFSMAAYYLLGGAFSMQEDAHVRMDLLYGRWSQKRQAFADSLTAFFIVFYLAFLLYGGFSSTQYAIEYDQKHYSAWAPPLAPVKIIMTIGIALMLLQAIALFFKDLARARGQSLS